MTPRPFDSDDEPTELDIADEVALADTGRPWAYRTRRHFDATPLPRQQDRRAS